MRRPSTCLLVALVIASACQPVTGDEPPEELMGADGQGGTVAVDDDASLPLAGTFTNNTPPPPKGNAGRSALPTAGTASLGGGASPNAGGRSSNAGGSESAGSTSIAGTTTGGESDDGTAPIAHGTCLDGIRDFGKDGPFRVTTKKSGAINFYVPGVPAGCKVPVVHLANGTGASCATYLASLQRLATHGFLAACYESTNTGAGDQGLKALDAALSLFPELADNKFGSTGHSQGGQAAFTVLALAEKKYGDKLIYAGLAMEPASGFGSQPTGTTWQALYGAIKSPMFMFSGLNTDGLVSQAWVQQAYDAMSKTVEAYFWTAKGATHVPVPNGEEQTISIPWFRWKLLGDQAACRAFVAIPKNDSKWAQVAAKNQQACQ